MSRPLAGLAATVGGAGATTALARELLGELGATVGPVDGRDRPALRLGPPGSAPARLRPLDPALGEPAGAGMPEGALALASARALTAGALAARLLDRPVEVDGLSVALQLQLPAVMAAAYGSEWWPTPPSPRKAPGGGWYNAELGGRENAEDFDRLTGTLPPDVDAATIAAAAQVWRLPVCDYREPAPVPPWRERGPSAPDAPEAGDRTSLSPDAASPPSGSPGNGSAVPALEGLRVLDLTSMWAGPLATWLLAGLGADVVKVEPPGRLDGFRARHGRGVWPGGRARRADGSESAVFNALNSAKRSVAVDAREDPATLARLAGEADMVVDSFSPRVMAQLGLDEAGGPSPSSPLRLSMPAFPAGPLRNWVAYGTGVHALSGLGFQPGDTGAPYRQPGVTYPDPLSGFLGAVLALAAVDARRRGSTARRYEVSLAGAVEPLVERRPLLRPPAPGTGPALLRAAIEAGAATAREDGAGVHWYPRSPFRGVSDSGRPAPPSPETVVEGAQPWRR